VRRAFEKQLSELIIPEFSQRFKGNDFRSLCGPGVYVFMDGELPLYVGMASNLLRRIGGWHHQFEAKKNCTDVLIYRTKSVDDAYKLEALLIAGLNPAKNMHRKRHWLNSVLGNKPNFNALQV
jgi:hypothetical protein